MTRGRVFRDTNAGPGVVLVAGEQKGFTLEQHWRSDMPPRVGDIVEIETDANGALISLRAVDNGTLAKEQAQKALQLAQAQGGDVAKALLSRVGWITLLATVMLGVAWYFMPILSVRMLGAQQSATFHDLLVMVNQSRDLSAIGSEGSAGLYGLLLILCLLAPAASHFVRNKWSSLAYVAPLAFMLGAILIAYFGVRSSMSNAHEQLRGFGGFLGGPQASELANNFMSAMFTEVWNATSMGSGLYVGLVVSGYLAFIGLRRVLARTPV